MNKNKNNTLKHGIRSPIHGCGTKGEEGTPCPSQSQSQSQSKAFEIQESSAKRHLPSQNKTNDLHLTYLPMPKTLPLSEGSPNILESASSGETSLTTMSSSISHCILSQPWIKWKTMTHLCSLWMSRPISTWSKRLWRPSRTLMCPMSTPWSGLMDGRRHMFDWLLTMMLWI